MLGRYPRGVHLPTVAYAMFDSSRLLPAQKQALSVGGLAKTPVSRELGRTYSLGGTRQGSEQVPREPAKEARGAMSTAVSIPTNVDYPSLAHAQDRAEFFSELREASPVVQNTRGEYLVTRWEEMRDVLQHPEIFRAEMT